MKQFVITVGCEYGCGGAAIGRILARNLGIPCYDRSIIDEIIEETGVSHDLMEIADAGKNVIGKAEDTNGRKYMNLTNRVIHIQTEVVKKLAARSSCVIIGRCSDYILQENRRCVNVFVYAPDEVRIANVQKELSVSVEEAKRRIEENDQMLLARYKQMTGTNWGERHNRHMLIDSSALGLEDTAKLIEEFARKKLANIDAQEERAYGK